MLPWGVKLVMQHCCRGRYPTASTCHVLVAGETSCQSVEQPASGQRCSCNSSSGAPAPLTLAWHSHEGSSGCCRLSVGGVAITLAIAGMQQAMAASGLATHYSGFIQCLGQAGAAHGRAGIRDARRRLRRPSAVSDPWMGPVAMSCLKGLGGSNLLPTAGLSCDISLWFACSKLYVRGRTCRC